jgi:hypothetical protein
MSMSKLVTMTSTVGDLTSGQTFRVRARTAELLVQQSKATILAINRITTANPATSEGKKVRHDMTTRLRLTKDYKDYKKGEVVELRSAEAKQIIKDHAATVQTDLGAESYQTKESSDGNTKNLRTNKSSPTLKESLEHPKLEQYLQ